MYAFFAPVISINPPEGLFADILFCAFCSYISPVASRIPFPFSLFPSDVFGLCLVLSFFLDSPLNNNNNNNNNLLAEAHCSPWHELLVHGPPAAP